MRRVLIVSAVLAAFVALPSIASAQAPPPEAGVGEYTENIPGAGGDQPSGGGQGGGGQGASDPGATSTGLPPSVVEEFEQQGADGAAAAALADSTSPAGSKPGGDGGGSAGQASSPAGDGQGGVGGVVEKIVGVNSSSQSDGMGIALPIILGASLLGALLFLLARRRGFGPTNA